MFLFPALFSYKIMRGKWKLSLGSCIEKKKGEKYFPWRKEITGLCCWKLLLGLDAFVQAIAMETVLIGCISHVGVGNTQWTQKVEENNFGMC